MYKTLLRTHGQPMPNATIKAYQIIRQGILDGKYPPGGQLREEYLASEIGVSRTPVRDALRRLLADGLVESERNHGTFVTDLTPEEVLEVFELRAILEGYGARRAAESITDEEIAELERLADAMEAVAGKEKLRQERWARLNTEFHIALVRASRSRRLERILRQMFQVPLVPLKQYRLRGLVNIDRSNRQHREIIEAMRERDAAWVSRTVEAHLLSTRNLASVLKDGTAKGASRVCM